MGDLILALVLLVLTLGAIGIVAVCTMWLIRRSADIYRFLLHDGMQKLKVDAVKGVAGTQTFLFVFEIEYAITFGGLLALLFVRRTLKIEATLEAAVREAVAQLNPEVQLQDIFEYFDDKIMALARIRLGRGEVNYKMVDITSARLVSITPTEPTKTDNQPAHEAGE